MDPVITVLLNAKAGCAQGRDLGAELAALFDAAKLTVQMVPTSSAVEAATSARVAANKRDATVVAVGGDGTVSHIAAALAGTKTPLGVIPAGTLNHFAKDLHIPLDFEQAVSTIAAGHVTRVDVGDVNDRVFVNNSSIGIYPDIVLERDVLRGKGYRKWTAFAMATVRILRRYRGVEVSITKEGEPKRTLRTPFLFIGNNAYQVDGLNLGAREGIAGGELFAYLTPRLRARDLPKLFLWAMVGRATSHGTLESVPAVELRVATKPRRLLHVALDGEVEYLKTPLHYRVRPHALAVIVPKG